MDKPSKPPPGARTPARSRGVSGRDPLSLRIQIEALLLDPRGHFRPRTLALQAPGARPEDELLVMQVGEHDDGSLSVVTAEPLAAGQAYLVQAAQEAPPQAGAAAPPMGRYLLAECRCGNRPEDGSQPCWVSTLRPQPPTGGAAPGA